MKKPEREKLEVPPGVKLVRHIVNDNDFGRYEAMVGVIEDARVFGAWMQRQREKASFAKTREFWEKYADKRRGKPLIC
jgi:hypothetical protein